MHPRSDIRAALKSILVDASTDAGARVYSGRVDPGFKPQLPAILIYSGHEVVQREDISKPGLRLRSVQVVIKAVQIVIATEGFQDQLDSFAKQIEDAIDANPLLNDTCETVWFDETEPTLLAGEGEDLLGIVNLIYSIQYRG